MPQPKVVRFAEIPVVPRGSGVETKPLLMESTGAQSFVSGVSTFPVGAALKLHKHNTEEMVVLLEGSATVEVGNPYPDMLSQRVCRGFGKLCCASRSGYHFNPEFS